MTSERRILISPKDIASVGWECPHCHATFLVPIARLDRDLGAICQNCSERFVSETQKSSSMLSESELIKSFLLRLRELIGSNIGKHLRLEIPEIKADGK